MVMEELGLPASGQIDMLMNGSTCYWQGPMPIFTHGTIHKCPKTGTGGMTSLHLSDRNVLICSSLQSKVHREKLGGVRALENPRLWNERNREVRCAFMAAQSGNWRWHDHVWCKGRHRSPDCNGVSNRLVTSVCKSDKSWTKMAEMYQLQCV